MSRLVQMQARFQQKQMAEKEEKLVKLYENQQQRAFERVSRGSAGSNANTTTTIVQAGKVRQMFDERRQKAGIDRSYPLEPLKTNKSNNRVVSLDRTMKPVKYGTKTVVQKTNIKNTISNKRLTNGVYNGVVDTEDELRYQDDINMNVHKNNRDIVSMLNDHNLNDTLDNVEMPNLALDEYDDIGFTGKLSNVGVRPLSESEISPRDENKYNKPPSISNTKRITTTTIKKEVKPPARKINSVSRTSPAKTASVPNRSLPPSITPTASGTPINSPRKTTSEMSARPTPRAPSNARPSAKPSGSIKASAVTRDDLVACKFCGRRFAEDRLQIHEDICARTGKKKRKQYDALKHRVAGTELEPFARKTRTTSQKISHTAITVHKPQPTKQGIRPPSSKKSDWRRKHEEFIAAIRSAKQAQQHIAMGGKLKDLPPPPPSYNPDYIQCPHCGRRFNETAAERHIPKCATYQHNKPNVNRPPARR